MCIGAGDGGLRRGEDRIVEVYDGVKETFLILGNLVELWWRRKAIRLPRPGAAPSPGNLAQNLDEFGLRGGPKCAGLRRPDGRHPFGKGWIVKSGWSNSVDARPASRSNCNRYCLYILTVALGGISITVSSIGGACGR